MRDGASTELLVGQKLPRPLLQERPNRFKAFVITQPGAAQVAADVATAIESTGVETEVTELPDRDRAKTLDSVSKIYESLARFGLGRDDTVVGVGGGSVTDVAGFVAGTWLRGVEVVHVPTTLLAAVDASIGGKTALNLAGKNMVGVLWHPTRVVVDTSVLASLSKDLIREGMVEALKTGLVGDPALFDLLEEHGLEAPIPEVVKLSVAVKMRIVTADPNEEGIRSHLNLGHTIGHAVEFASGFSHGDSVSIGLVAAAALSDTKLGFGGRSRIERALKLLGAPTQAPSLKRDEIVDLIARDKKRTGAATRMVLLQDIGKPAITEVSSSEVGLALSSIGL